MAMQGKSWDEMRCMECQICQTHRENRTRLIAPNDARIHEPAFLHAPYVHQNNEPKYHAMLLRSVEQAKHRYDAPRHILWVTAQDTPHNPKEISDNPAAMQKKLDRFFAVPRSTDSRHSRHLPNVPGHEGQSEREVGERRSRHDSEAYPLHNHRLGTALCR